MRSPLSRDLMTRTSNAGQTMNPTPIARKDAVGTRFVRQRLDQLEVQMWDRARMNLMLLYNGSRNAGSTSPVATSGTLGGPLVASNLEI